MEQMARQSQQPCDARLASLHRATPQPLERSPGSLLCMIAWEHAQRQSDATSDHEASSWCSSGSVALPSSQQLQTPSLHTQHLQPYPPQNHGQGYLCPSINQEWTEGATQGQRECSREQKKINRKLARMPMSQEGVEKLLQLVSAKLLLMNGVNLATALHRLARCSLAGVPVGHSNFAHTMEAMHAAVEKLIGSASLPPNCASIIAWSCAHMGKFRVSLFSSLAKLASCHLLDFQPQELTNIMCAYAEFFKHFPDFVDAGIAELFDLAERRLRRRSAGEFKVQYLASAVISFGVLSQRGGSDRREICFNIAHELASRSKGAALSTRREVLDAFDALRSMGVDFDSRDSSISVSSSLARQVGLCRRHSRFGCLICGQEGAPGAGELFNRCAYVTCDGLPLIFCL
eukprot:TRINITY_DN5624_c0_g1_i7.p1 TRINITY_DN5624_c0_g1~~TRINITY_DN5624_c0_g1_i7.p1  ORF type:complete len:403 (+),score=61.82 TRINITY_DN5624_c0_g1_i7:63-1271(+)